MSDSDDQDYAFYGTPLEPLEDDEIPRKKPIALEDQVVTDKQGRRRFHGAFTGGFSAGFYNTVGSLEGWKPSTFKSSRESKAEQRLQRPEDFMDEEDTDVFGIAPTVLRAKPEYRGGTKSTRKRPTFHEGPIPGEPVLNSVIEPAHETVGVQLLMKMGWKPGQGIGPRLTKLEKKREKQQRAKENYGFQMHGRQARQDSSTEDEEEDLDTSILFAPDDYEVFLATPKTDKFGLGYEGLASQVLTSHLNLFDSSEGLQMVDKQKKVSIKGQAFGVGAFETEDFDIYAKDDMSQYDFSLETSAQIAERKRKEREARKNKEKAYLTNCDIIEGFVPAKGEPETIKHYPPPQLPENYQPIHNPKVSRFDVPPPLSAKELGWRKHFITAPDRAVALGETSTATLHEETLSKAKEITSNLPEISQGGFKPFISDPDKQKRYEKYLQLVKIGAKDALSSLQPITMTDWEKEREKGEFDQAAKLYKPLSGMMAERFAPAELADDLNDPLAPVKKLSTAVPEMEAAAKAKMFGKLTRVVKEWAPVSLLCKRFNIAEPNTTKESLEKGADKWTRNKPNFSVFDMLEASQENTFTKGSQAGKETDRVEDDPEEGPSEPNKEKVVDTSPQPLPSTPPPLLSSSAVSISPELAKELGFKDPPDKKDLFKAIFLSSSEDEEEEEAAPLKNPSSSNVLRNTSPPRGIFADLDLDALNTMHQPKPKKPPEGGISEADPPSQGKSELGKKPEVKGKPEDKLDEMDPLMYGPKPPEPSSSQKIKFIPRAVSVSDSSDSDSDMWVEKSSEKEKKHKKHSKKHKKEKKKSKSKHKDKKKKKK